MNRDNEYKIITAITVPIICLILVIYSILLSGCNTQYVPIVDNPNMYNMRITFDSDLTQLQGDIVAKLDMSAVDENGNPGPFAEREFKGVGFWVGENLFMTATHVVYPKLKMTVNTFFGPMEQEYAYLNRRYTVNGYQAKLVERFEDICLLVVDTAPKQEFLKIASGLRLSQQVFNVGNPGLTGIFVKAGIVGKFVEQNGDEGLMKALNMDTLTGFIGFNLLVMGGDSGSPLITVENGEYVYAGMVSATFGAGHAYGAGPNVLQAILNRYEK